MQAIQSEKKRLLSLDVFRGITVAAMILVNNPGDWSHIYAPLEHSDWNGCTPTDLIFPFFLFIVGVSIVYALDNKLSDLKNHNTFILSISKRAAILFGLGLLMFLQPYFDFAHFRIPGVLQRIAIVYFVCALLFLKVKQEKLFTIFIIILIAYWLMMILIPVPDFGEANLGKETNLGAWLDRFLLTENHLWINSKTWDPEGILGTLPSIASGLFGILMGKIFKSKQKTEENKVVWLFVYGFIAFLFGLAWDLFFPINKSLWTSSYVLYAGGLASISLALLYWIIDVKGFSRFTKPFVIYGVNAITVYFVSGVVARSMNILKVNLDGQVVSWKDYLYLQFYAPNFSPENASVAWAISFVLIWFLILWVMYKKGIVIKV
ncbi:N-acetylglucosamine transporter [Pedobacter psychrophilus]|uniref:N-acetylglucosamine transporter n=2 Tax=Pedobacter psychrophilus TaxID=1826909 RepID=A0A179DED7_9SPHI|nr:N-acetylglucosamine transporter [Pedobacter psychrophilus]